MAITAAENDFQTWLEQARLRDSLNNPEEAQDEEEQESEGGPEGKQKIAKLMGKAAWLSGKLGHKEKAEALKKAAEQLAKLSPSAIKMGLSRGQYLIWQIMWETCVATFGLTLLLVYVPIGSWLIKKFGPSDIAKMLPEPGEDGLIGIVPPPDTKTAKYVKPFYGIVNLITMFSLGMILTLILFLLLIMIILPPFLILDMARRLFGPLGETISRIFGGL